MKVLHNASEAGRLYPSAVVAIGKFDAMHRGHLRVVRSALRRAQSLRTSCVVVSFDPSPEQFLRLYRYRPVLSLGEKIRILKGLGVDAVLLLPFDKRLACLSPEAFVGNVLALRLRPLSVFVGADFCFGKDRAGNVETLERLGFGSGFSVHAVPLLKAGRQKISASRIRELLNAGKLAEAEKLLGRSLR